MAGKYLGGTMATGLPILLVMLIAGCFEAVHRGSPTMLGWALVAFSLVMLPGLALASGFAVICPMVITAPLFRVLFVGYWVWANLVGPEMLPSTSGTLLAPIGDYSASWLSGDQVLYAGDDGWLAFLRPDVTAGNALLSAGLLTVVGLLPVLLAGHAVDRQRATS